MCVTLRECPTQAGERGRMRYDPFGDGDDDRVAAVEQPLGVDDRHADQLHPH